MNTEQAYPIGTSGQPWGDKEKAQWLAKQQLKRSYQDEVVFKIRALGEHFAVTQYGELSIDTVRYPLLSVSTRNPDKNKPTILITGGVHGYETSGVQGAIRFLHTRARDFEAHFNILAAPCVSPWGYETINRWNPRALDPNRSFYPDSPAEESAALMHYIARITVKPLVHMDLHETTDTDNSEFRPALSARDGKAQAIWNIPDGFYTVGDTEKPQPGFQRAIIQSVQKVTHIAPADPDGKIIGETLQQPGVINYTARSLGLCMGVTDAPYVSTTEVYPDSPLVDDENCILAQVAAVEGALSYAISQSG